MAGGLYPHPRAPLPQAVEGCGLEGRAPSKSTSLSSVPSPSALSGSRGKRQSRIRSRTRRSPGIWSRIPRNTRLSGANRQAGRRLEVENRPLPLTISSWKSGGDAPQGRESSGKVANLSPEVTFCRKRENQTWNRSRIASILDLKVETSDGNRELQDADVLVRGFLAEMGHRKSRIGRESSAGGHERRDFDGALVRRAPALTALPPAP